MERRGEGDKSKKSRKITFNALLGAVELGELVSKNLLTEHAIHFTLSISKAGKRKERNRKEEEEEEEP